MKTKKARRPQLEINFSKSSAIHTTPKAEQTEGKVISLNQNEEIYRRILTRKME